MRDTKDSFFKCTCRGLRVSLGDDKNLSEKAMAALELIKKAVGLVKADAEAEDRRQKGCSGVGGTRR